MSKFVFEKKVLVNLVKGMILAGNSIDKDSLNNEENKSLFDEMIVGFSKELDKLAERELAKLN